MPRTIRGRQRKQSIEAQFALAERVLRNLNRSIDDQLDRARDLEVERAIALHKSGKAQLIDGDEMFNQIRQRIG